MRAFVIKNKEGKYLDNCQDFETNNICDARLFDDYKEALSFSPKYCEVAEITIAEADLERKVKELQKHIIEFINELAWKDVKYDAYQSTMGDMPASRSAIPRYAKKYFDFWKEMFGENIQQAKEHIDE